MFGGGSGTRAEDENDGAQSGSVFKRVPLTYLEGVTLKVILFSEYVFMFSCFLLGFRFYCVRLLLLLLLN